MILYYYYCRAWRPRRHGLIFRRGYTTTTTNNDDDNNSNTTTTTNNDNNNTTTTTTTNNTFNDSNDNNNDGIPGAPPAALRGPAARLAGERLIHSLAIIIDSY